MKKLLPYSINRDKIIYTLFFLFSSFLMLAQTITPIKTITLDPTDCKKIDIQLKIKGENPIVRPLEVVLVIDVSGSMNSPSPTSSLTYAKIAAKDFIDKTFLPINNPTGKNKIAIVSFSETATLKKVLTDKEGSDGIGGISGADELKSVITGLTANGWTNLQDAIVKANNELKTHGTYDCATARSIVLLTDGATNRTGSTGSSCPDGTGSTSCAQSAITAATAAKTTSLPSDPNVYSTQFFSIALTGGITGSDITTAHFTLDNIQMGGYPAYYTADASLLTGIYSEIFTKLSWTAKNIVVKETVIPGYTISLPPGLNPSKGIALISGQEINWTVDFLNIDEITLNYKLTSTAENCGTQVVSSTSLQYTNSTCSVDSKVVLSPSLNIPCPTVANAGADKTGSDTCGLTTVTLDGNTPVVGTGKWTIVSGTGGSFALDTDPKTTFSGT
ncbi:MULTISPECIES: vWA domain-containing protein, partial [unclassified Flavobacterium]|uniref:vWA domain-containing protein n=1 Tax=unclassified Flavobacterium TaxID=196869 RepID=UPI003F904F5D